MDNIRLTYEVEGGDLTQAGEASAQVKQTLRKLGFDPDTIRRVSVCMYEGEINMVIHADGGTATVDWMSISSLYFFMLGRPMPAPKPRSRATSPAVV